MYVREPCAPLYAPERKIFYTQGVYVTMSNGVFNFNFLALLFSKILGGVKIFGGNPPRNAMTADLRRLVKKIWRCSKYPIVCTLDKEITKKRNVYVVRVTFHPCAALTP